MSLQVSKECIKQVKSKPVDYGYFLEVCWKLGLNWKKIADLEIDGFVAKIRVSGRVGDSCL